MAQTTLQYKKNEGFLHNIRKPLFVMIMYHQNSNHAYATTSTTPYPFTEERSFGKPETDGQRIPPTISGRSLAYQGVRAQKECLLFYAPTHFTASYTASSKDFSTINLRMFNVA